MRITYKHVCLQKMICVNGEMVRESKPAFLDTDTGVVKLVTAKGQDVDVPWSMVEFALPLGDEVKPVEAKVVVAERPPEPKGPPKLPVTETRPVGPAIRRKVG